MGVGRDGGWGVEMEAEAAKAAGAEAEAAVGFGGAPAMEVLGVAEVGDKP